MAFKVPKDHPRYDSLMARHLLEDGLAKGITTPTGMIAHGRGEAFDYLLGERSHPFAERAAEAAAAKLLLAKSPILSVNGNTAVLVTEKLIALSKAVSAPLEINLFHDAPGRRKAISDHFEKNGASILGVSPDAKLPNLSSDRAKVDSRGMLNSDVVLVSLEDGDRTEALQSSGKYVIAIDLNPLSRTPQKAEISIIDNVSRALPLIAKHAARLNSEPAAALSRIVDLFDNSEALHEAERAIREAN